MSTEIETQGGREVSIIDGVKHVKMACKAGHDWWRVSQKGKPPHWCAEHMPAKPAPKPRVKAVTAEGKVNGPASKRTPNSEIEAQIAEKEAKDMAQATGEDKKNAPKSIAELEAEREAQLARERRKAEQELADIDTAIEAAQKEADEKSEANLAAMDKVNDRDPKTLSKQQSTYALALHACADLRRLERRKADLLKAVK
jgi:hypothetical protein